MPMSVATAITPEYLTNGQTAQTTAAERTHIVRVAKIVRKHIQIAFATIPRQTSRMLVAVLCK